MSITCPPGFVIVPGERRGRLVLARKGAEEFVAWTGRLDPERLIEERGHRSGGRGSIVRIPVSEDSRRTPVSPKDGRDAAPSDLTVATGRGGSYVLKKYRRGGATSRILPDLFLGPSRMLADLRISEEARLKGIPCPIVRALILDRIGILWRGYLLTEEIANARTLDSALVPPAYPLAGSIPPHGETSSLRGNNHFEQGPFPAAGSSARPSSPLDPPVRMPDVSTSSPREMAERAIRLVRRLHDAGILHRDLNIRNILVSGQDVYVIDLDGARTPRVMTFAHRFSNLSRLDRSYLKVLGDRGPLSHAQRLQLLDVYCSKDADMRREFLARLPAHKRSVARHALLWRTRA